MKYLLRRCDICLTASEASSCDEVKFLPSAKVVGLRRIVLPQSLRDSSLNEGAKRAFLAEEGGFSEGKDGWSSHRHLPRENFTSVHFCLSLLGEVADRNV